VKADMQTLMKIFKATVLINFLVLVVISYEMVTKKSEFDTKCWEPFVKQCEAMRGNMSSLNTSSNFTNPLVNNFSIIK
jgi:hypothetical protein